MTSCGARSAGERDLWDAIESLSVWTERSRPALVSVDRRASPFASSARLEEVDAAYADGTRVSLMFKQLGQRGLLPAARRAKPRFVHDPAREIRVYREILDRFPLDTPRFLGSVLAPRLGRYWLFMERVPGGQLRWATDDVSWDRTAARLATVHGVLLAEADRDDVSLVAYDRAFYLRWLTRARRFSATTDRPRRASLERIAAGYHRAVDLLVSLPRTVVHGQLYPSNVLVDETTPTGRVCVVDWEVAGVGPAANDLAALTAGAPTDRREAMVDAYFAAMPLAVRTVGDRRLLDESVTHARLALAVQWLGWSAAWSAPPEQANDWLAEAVALSEQIR